MALPNDDAAAAATRRQVTMGRLASALAHDFNNLLTAILGYAELLLDDMPAGDARRRDLQEIQRSGERAATLTRHLLAFRRNAEAPAQLLSWPALIRELWPLLEAAAGDRVRVVIEADDVPEICLQKADASHVLFAIVLLARDALPCGGHCGFQVRRARVDGVSVTATLEPEAGAGPAPLPGWQLTVIAQLIAASGGTLSLSNQWPVRQRFVMQYEGASASAGQSQGAQQADGTPVATLLIVDDAALRRLVHRMLEGVGLTVTDAAGGPEALACLREAEPAFDLLVTDLVPPEPSGTDLLRALAGRRPDAGALFISGSGEGPGGDAAAAGAAWVLLPKPFTREQLARAVADLQARRRNAQA